MNAITTTSPAVPTLSNAMMPHDMTSAIRLAEIMSKGRLLPTHLQDKPGDCLMVIEQAMRWGMSPFAVAQSTSVIQGKLMFEGKLVAAALQSSGILSSRLAYDYDGEGATRAVTVSAIMRGEEKPRTVRVTLSEAKTTNGMWTKQPDQQLVYAGTRVWARRHAPEVMLGVYSPEEFEQPHREPYTAGPTIDARPEPVRQPIVDDSIPALDEAPMYPFTSKGGTSYYGSAQELLTTWGKCIANMTRAGSLDRLPGALAMNGSALASIEAHDAATAAQIRDMVAAALGTPDPVDDFPGVVTPSEAA